MGAQNLNLYSYLFWNISLIKMTRNADRDEVTILSFLKLPENKRKS